MYAPTVIGLLCGQPALLVAKDEVNPLMEVLGYVRGLQTLSHLPHKVSRVWAGQRANRATYYTTDTAAELSSIKYT